MISDLERLAALHQNGQLDDAEFKLAKEKLLNGGGESQEVALRLELIEMQRQIDENAKNWRNLAEASGATILGDGSVMAPNQLTNMTWALLGGFLLYFICPSEFPKFTDAWDFIFAAIMAVLALMILMMVFTYITAIVQHKTTLKRFLAAQSEHNAQQLALRNRIAELQQQLT